MDPTTTWVIIGVIGFALFCKVTGHMRNNSMELERLRHDAEERANAGE